MKKNLIEFAKLFKTKQGNHLRNFKKEKFKQAK